MSSPADSEARALLVCMWIPMRRGWGSALLMPRGLLETQRFLLNGWLSCEAESESQVTREIFIMMENRPPLKEPTLIMESQANLCPRLLAGRYGVFHDLRKLLHRILSTLRVQSILGERQVSSLPAALFEPLC